jgi:hypothetical protein
MTSVVNKLDYIIKNKRINFIKIAGKFNYKMLMKRKDVKFDEKIIEEYIRQDRSKKWKIRKQDNLKSDHKLFIYKEIRNELLSIHNDISYVVDVLVKYLYEMKHSRFKETLWWSFGDVILSNLKLNIGNTIRCECCGKRVEKLKQRQNLCLMCFDTDRREKAKIRKNRFKKKD